MILFFILRSAKRNGIIGIINFVLSLKMKEEMGF